MSERRPIHQPDPNLLQCLPLLVTVLHLHQSSCHLIKTFKVSCQTLLSPHLLLTALLTGVKVLPIIEPSLLAAPRGLKQEVGNLVDIFELWAASEKDNLLEH